MIEHRQTNGKQELPLYAPAEFYLLRAPLLPAQIFTSLATEGHLLPQNLRPESNLENSMQISQERCTCLLRQLATQPHIIQALAVASPSLLDAVVRLQRNEGSPAQQKRTLAGLLRYIIRMSTRPTPFGLFSGVALGRFADVTDARLIFPAIACFRTRPDMAWLLALLRKLEEDPVLVKQMRVRLNQTAYLVGERAILPLADTYGTQDNRSISLRATAVVRKIFELAQHFISYIELQAAIQQAFPHATMQQVERVLEQLWEHHFLISELHPPLTHARPAEYVLAHLESVQGIDAFKAQLTGVLKEAASFDAVGVGAPPEMLSTLVQRQQQLVPTETREQLPLQVDSALRLHSPTLHLSIGRAAAQIATFLLRQTPFPHGFPPLQEYRILFLEKYGEQAEVPLLDLLSPESGLDAPPGYERPARAYQRPSYLQTPATSSRDQVLLELVTTAINQRCLEVELTETLQQRLERWSPNREEAPLSLEIYLHLHAASREAVDRGEWTAVVGRSCGSHRAGRTFGRFFDLLGEAGMAALHSLAEREAVLQPDVLFAELSYQPPQARQANVAIRPPILSYEIAVGTTPAVPHERVLTLNDLVVGVQDGRFYLRSLRLGKQVRVCQTHMLNTQLAPNACRFISEIANDGQPVLNSFDWGIVANAPFLPRLILKPEQSCKIVITPACWHLQAETITSLGEGSDEGRWFRGLQQWRERWSVPRYVYLTEADNRLLLDLENPLMAAQLHEELRKQDGQKRVMLDELLPDFEHLWLSDEQGSGYFSEIVVPLLHIDAMAPASQPMTPTRHITSREQIIMQPERKRFPGEDWIYFKLYAAPSQHDDLLADPVREIVRVLQEHELLDRWFFIRYNDPEPHLRLRFHARESVRPLAILNLVLPWCLCLARSGQIQRYTLDTYEREVERYGGPEAIDLLEQVFTIDSVLVSDILAFQQAHHLTLDSLAVAVVTLDHFFTAWGCNLQERLNWTHTVSEKYAWSSEFRPERKRYCELLSPGGQCDVELAEQRARLLELVRPHEAFLGAARTQIQQLEASGTLWGSETSLLTSLAHMHVNRLLGIDRHREKQIYAFWRHTLESLARRPARAQT